MTVRIKISQTTLERIHRNDKNLEGEDAIINDALRALERSEEVPFINNLPENIPLYGTFNEKHLQKVRLGWKGIVVEILKALGDRKGKFENFPNKRLRKGYVRGKNYTYIEEVDMSFSSLDARNAQKLIKDIGKHFNLDIEIAYKGSFGEKEVLLTRRN